MELNTSSNLSDLFIERSVRTPAAPAYRQFDGNGWIDLTWGEAAREVGRWRAALRKENLKTDAEAQLLEDAACLVFLENFFTDFSRRHDDAKVIDILRKTWAKMSAKGHAAALTLKDSLPDDRRRLVEAALAAA